MFDRLKNKLNNFQVELEKLNTEGGIPVSIKEDGDGYVDKECPNPDCLFSFKVNLADWVTIFKDEKVFCPMCRYEATSNFWLNSVQIQEGREQVIRQVRGRILSAWEGRTYKQDLITISAMEEMRHKIQCSECNAKFAVIGSAFFCPCCGHNSVERTFDESLRKVEIKLSYIEKNRVTIGADNKDDAEILYRSMIEGALSDLVVAFQRYCEYTFLTESPNENIQPNVFQRLEEGSKLWRKMYGSGYEDWLSKKEFSRMNTFFQRRHLLSHKEGLVDGKYLQKANDHVYKLEQRIVVKDSDVNELLQLVKKVVTKIRELRTKK